ncbi:MAG: DUF2264 domain-containing protein [Spirochaetales bacterium]|jgi:hypothetical protein|nr:DUF2264 domain-containing protein [Spirochaetales bacterium]
MENKQKRFEIYRDIADRLTETCLRSIDADGLSKIGRSHGAPSVGHVSYVLGELSRRRPDLNLSSLHGIDLIGALRSMIVSRLDLNNEIHRCFLAMGLGMSGPADPNHMVLKGVPDQQRKLINEGLVVTNAFDNNWEAFNGSILIGRFMLYGDPAENVLGHFEKIAAKYDETGYFDDTINLGNYNNYGFMSINYPLRASEFLEKGHPVRGAIEALYRDHALRYVALIQALVSPDGDTWPFGRSAGVLGLLQCVTLIEQCLSKNWIDPSQVNHVRAITRRATNRMHDLYWDDSQGWFDFRDDYHTAYDYRASFPMAWDMLRYFLQIEEYAAIDEQIGVPEQEVAVHQGPCHKEIVTNPSLKTAVYVWSDGSDHAVLPIMAGPHEVTGDSLARPYSQGLFEWTTQNAIPALCPRLSIEGENYWPSWHAEKTELRTEGAEGESRIYKVIFNPLQSDKGQVCPHAIGCETKYVFSSGLFQRIDTWSIQQVIDIDGYLLEVLQPAKHPKRPRFGEVKQLRVEWESDIEAIKLAEKEDVGGDPIYRNYHGYASHSWKIRANEISLEAGTYTTILRLRW